MSPARNGSKWIRQERRRAIYERDGWACLYCGWTAAMVIRSHPLEFILTLDHVRDHSNHSNNLATCCRSCNSAKRNISQRAWYALLRKRLGLTVAETRKIQRRLYRQLKKKPCLMEDTNATQTAQFSIHDINVSDQSDEALQQMHDDILADEVRFLDHVGIGPGTHFLVELVTEMKDREMEIHESLRHRFDPQQAPGAKHQPLREIGFPTPLNRKQRRAIKSKAKHG